MSCVGRTATEQIFLSRVRNIVVEANPDLEDRLGLLSNEELHHLLAFPPDLLDCQLRNARLAIRVAFEKLGTDPFA
jgi:hypothetical protein